MSLFRLAAVAGVIALSAYCYHAFAESDVLLPSDNETVTSPPSYLGLTPAESDTASDQAKKPDTKESNYQTFLPSLDPDAGDKTANYTPAPANVTAKSRNPSNTQQPAPQTISMPLPPAVSTKDDASSTGSIRVSIANKYKWGNQDVSIVERALGINTSDVPEKCVLGAKGTAHSDSGTGIYTFDVNATDAILHYDGKLKDVTMRLNALCNKVPLPASARYVMEVGGKYSVSLSSQVNCDTPPANAQSVTLQYSGDGSGKCEYK